MLPETVVQKLSLIAFEEYDENLAFFCCFSSLGLRREKSSFRIIVNETHVSVRPLSLSITDSITDNKLPIFVKRRTSVRDKIQGKWKCS